MNDNKIITIINNKKKHTKENLRKGSALYFSLKVCKKLVRKKSGSAVHCLAEK